MTIKSTNENQNSRGKSGFGFISVPHHHFIYCIESHTEIFLGNSKGCKPLIWIQPVIILKFCMESPVVIIIIIEDLFYS